MSDNEFCRVTDEQAALRRLATLVAHGVSPEQVLDAVAEEMGRVLNAKYAILVACETDCTVRSVGSWNYGGFLARGTRWAIEKGTALDVVWRTGAPGRVESYEGDGPMVTQLRDYGFTSSVGCPITVGRSLWGVAILSAAGSERFPPDTERRMMNFTELASASIANAQSRAELQASRARIVTATDESRRRIERDLHDGTQQRLVSIGLELRAIEAAMPQGLEELKKQVSDAAGALQDTLIDLQEISRGLHPAILARGGLSKAVAVLVRRSALAVVLNVALDRRLPERAEVTAYYVISEALANVAKHAHARVVHVDVTLDEPFVRVLIRDDGVGGADPAAGSGLVGLTDRVEALGGRLQIISPAGGGTSLTAEIPLQLG